MLQQRLLGYIQAPGARGAHEKSDFVLGASRAQVLGALAITRTSEGSLRELAQVYSILERGSQLGIRAAILQPYLGHESLIQEYYRKNHPELLRKGHVPFMKPSDNWLEALEMTLFYYILFCHFSFKEGRVLGIGDVERLLGVIDHFIKERSRLFHEIPGCLSVDKCFMFGLRLFSGDHADLGIYYCKTCRVYVAELRNNCPLCSQVPGRFNTHIKQDQNKSTGKPDILINIQGTEMTIIEALRKIYKLKNFWHAYREVMSQYKEVCVKVGHTDPIGTTQQGVAQQIQGTGNRSITIDTLYIYLESYFGVPVLLNDGSRDVGKTPWGRLKTSGELLLPGLTLQQVFHNAFLARSFWKYIGSAFRVANTLGLHTRQFQFPISQNGITQSIYGERCTNIDIDTILNDFGYDAELHPVAKMHPATINFGVGQRILRSHRELDAILGARVKNGQSVQEILRGGYSGGDFWEYYDQSVPSVNKALGQEGYLLLPPQRQGYAGIVNAPYVRGAIL